MMKCNICEKEKNKYLMMNICQECRDKNYKYKDKVIKSISKIINALNKKDTIYIINELSKLKMLIIKIKI